MHAGKRVKKSLRETGEPELDPRTHAKNKTEPETNKKTKSAGVVPVLVLPELGRWRQLHSWEVLDIFGKFQANERPCLKTQGKQYLKNTTQGCPLASTHKTHEVK